MNSEQKRAVYVLSVLLIAVICYLALIPFLGPIVACGAFGLSGLMGLSQNLFRKKKRQGEVEVDERDAMIVKKGGMAGFAFSYLTFVAGCMVPWFICMCLGKYMISIHILPAIVFAGALVLMSARSITILVLYGRCEIGDNN